MTLRLSAALLFFLVASAYLPADDETLPALQNGHVPQSIDEIWSGFDPRKEPLDNEILKEWEQDGLVCRIVRFRVGIFKGTKSLVAAIYAFPKAATNLPALVQIHGGGQSANLNAAITNARHGYASLSLNWGGNPLNDGAYKKIWPNPATDWGKVDATHPPQRDPLNHFIVLTPNEFTIDPVESPRNSNWLLVTIAVRRALTFLEQQPEVDSSRLGIYGHSMGAKLTILTGAIDNRVKAAVPSCGGISDYPSELLWENSHYCRKLAVPTLFLNPVNDFYGKVDDLNRAAAALPPQNVRFVCSPNLDHRDKPDHFVCGPLWFDQHLKGTFTFPQTPRASLELKTSSGIPRISVTPDLSRPLLSVDVFYTQQTRDENSPNPCWRHVPATQSENTWSADLPLASIDRPLRVYANVRYPLEAPITGAGYYYSLYTATNFTISSPLITATPDSFRAAGLEPSDKPSLLIEDFAADWQKGWYVFNENGSWPYRTNKLQDPKWKAPAGAKLLLEIQSPQPNQLVLQIDDYACAVNLPGQNNWHTISLTPADFTDVAGTPLADWPSAKEFVLADKLTLNKNDKQKSLGAPWSGPLPTFRNLHWQPAH